jgi:hypothetical protein
MICLVFLFAWVRPLAYLFRGDSDTTTHILTMQRTHTGTHTHTHTHTSVRKASCVQSRDDYNNIQNVPGRDLYACTHTYACTRIHTRRETQQIEGHRAYRLEEVMMVTTIMGTQWEMKRATKLRMYGLR